MEFPSGQKLSKPKLPIGRFYRATGTGFILIRPFGKASFYLKSKRSALAEISTERVILSDGAMDVLGRYYVAEKVVGKEVGLYEIDKGLQASVELSK